MKAFLASVAVAVLLGVGAMMLLDSTYQRTADSKYSTTGARVGDPGNNLVGKSWYSPRS